MPTGNLVHAAVYLVVVAAAVSLSHPAAAEIDCQEVELKVTPCFPFIKDGGRPSSSCCRGVISLRNEIRSRSDMRDTCNCLKDLMPRHVTEKQADHVEDLPERCHVRIPYPLSLKTDCAR